MKKLMILCIFISMELYGSTIKIMPLGDSITYDNTYADLENPRPTGMRSAYRNYLWYMLQDGGFNVDFVGSKKAGQYIKPAFDVDNEGYSGWSSYSIAERTYRVVKSSSPDIILLHAGSNDWDDSPRGVEKILDEIDTYEDISGKEVVVILALIINRKDYERWISVFNANLKRMAQRRIDNGDKIVIVNMEKDAHINYKQDMRDPAHPTDLGYKKMAGVWYNAIKKVYAKLEEERALEEEEKALEEERVAQEQRVLEDRRRNSKIFPLQFYHYILEREPEEEALEAWANYLERGSVTSVAMSFFNSQEYANKEIDNGKFLDILYGAILGRDSDSDGLEYWIEELENNAMSRDNVLEIFLNSKEFVDTTSDYNLITVRPEDSLLFN